MSVSASLTGGFRLAKVYTLIALFLLGVSTASYTCISRDDDEYWCNQGTHAKSNTNEALV